MFSLPLTGTYPRPVVCLLLALSSHISLAFSPLPEVGGSNDIIMSEDVGTVYSTIKIQLLAKNNAGEVLVWHVTKKKGISLAFYDSSLKRLHAKEVFSKEALKNSQIILHDVIDDRLRILFYTYSLGQEKDSTGLFRMTIDASNGNKIEGPTLVHMSKHRGYALQSKPGSRNLVVTNSINYSEGESDNNENKKSDAATEPVAISLNKDLAVMQVTELAIPFTGGLNVLEAVSLPDGRMFALYEWIYTLKPRGALLETTYINPICYLIEYPLDEEAITTQISTETFKIQSIQLKANQSGLQDVYGTYARKVRGRWEEGFFLMDAEMLYESTDNMLLYPNREAGLQDVRDSEGFDFSDWILPDRTLLYLNPHAIFAGSNGEKWLVFTRQYNHVSTTYDHDIFIAKFGANQNLLWTRHLPKTTGGSGSWQEDVGSYFSFSKDKLEVLLHIGANVKDITDASATKGTRFSASIITYRVNIDAYTGPC